MPQTLIIAEAGINHNRSVDDAKRLVDAAQAAGADVVKFQLELPVQGREVHTLTWDEQMEVYAYCRKVKMEFACTAFDARTLEMLLTRCVMPFIKIASLNWCLDQGHAPWFELIEKSALPIILSSRSEKDLWRLNSIRKIGRQVSVLHCVGEYPTPPERADLKRIPYTAHIWKLPIGISDHSQGIAIPIAAVTLGASIVEKHITMNTEQKGPDHKASLNPWWFKEMVKGIREVEKALA